MTPAIAPTGIAAFDAARWINAPLRVSGTALPSGAKLLRLRFRPSHPMGWEAEVPAAADHLVIWRGGPRLPVEVRVAGQCDTAAGQRRRNGYLVPAGAESRWAGRCSEPSQSLHVHLPPAWLAGLAEESGLPAAAAAPAARFGLSERRVALVLQGLTFAWSEDGSLPHAALDHWMLLLGCALLPVPRQHRRGRLDARALGRLAEFLQANLQRDIGLAEMAAIADMPCRSFSAAFRAATGEAPHRHLARLRRERAEVLLRSTRLPLADIALLAGFRGARPLRAVLSRAGAPAGDEARP